MARTKTEPRTVTLAEIRGRFTLVPLNLGGRSHPAVAKDAQGRYSIRILKHLDYNASTGLRQEKFDYFYCDADGTITTAPRGHAKDFRPGRIDPAELDAVIARIEAAVARGATPDYS